MSDELKDLMRSAYKSYEAAGVHGTEGARAMKEGLARIEELEAKVSIWRDISQAPLDGQIVDLWMPMDFEYGHCRIPDMMFDGENWVCAINGRRWVKQMPDLKWMFRPEAPEVSP